MRKFWMVQLQGGGACTCLSPCAAAPSHSGSGGEVSLRPAPRDYGACESLATGSPGEQPQETALISDSSGKFGVPRATLPTDQLATNSGDLTDTLSFHKSLE